MLGWRSPREWSAWGNWLAAGWHGRCRRRVPVLFYALLFAQGHRTVASWLRAAGIGCDFSDDDSFIAAVRRKAEPAATRLLVLLWRSLPVGDGPLFGLDDTPSFVPFFASAVSVPCCRGKASVRMLSTDHGSILPVSGATLGRLRNLNSPASALRPQWVTCRNLSYQDQPQGPV
jgi:hypothetical protein